MPKEDLAGLASPVRTLSIKISGNRELGETGIDPG